MADKMLLSFSISLVHISCPIPSTAPYRKELNMILILSWQTLCRLALLLTCFFRGVFSTLQLMTISGLVAEITGYPGLSYEAARYEPLCGQFGTGSIYDAQWDFCGFNCDAETCSSAMDEYSNNTDTLAIYDINGIRLKDVRVGGGLDTCMCFSLARTDGFMSDFCFWINGAGQADSLNYGNTGASIVSSYRPNSQKALPICSSVDINSLSEQWSATAYQPSVYEIESTVGNGIPTTATVFTVSMITKTTTFIPSLVSFTSFSTATSTLANGNSSTFTTAITIQLPVVTSTATSTAAPSSTTSLGNGGYNLGDRIALGVGIGVGLPTVLIALVALWKMWH